MSLDRIAGHGAFAIGSDFRHGMAFVFGEKIIGQEIVLYNCLAVPVGRITVIVLRRALAGMAASAVLGEDDPSTRNDGAVFGKRRRAAVCIGKAKRRQRSQERFETVHARLGCGPSFVACTTILARWFRIEDALRMLQPVNGIVER